MNNPKILVNIALLLILVNAFGGVLYAALIGVPVNTSAIIPRAGLVFFLCSMVYLEKNWARLTVGTLAIIAALGLIATIILHFYTNSPGSPHPSLYIQLAVFLISGLLLLIPKSVRQYFKGNTPSENIT